MSLDGFVAGPSQSVAGDASGTHGQSDVSCCRVACNTTQLLMLCPTKEIFMHTSTKRFTILVSSVLLGACAAEGTGPGSTSANAVSNTTASSAGELPPIQMPAFAVGDSCTFERTVNGKTQTDQRVLTQIADGKNVWSSSIATGAAAVIEFDSATQNVVHDVTLSNNQKASFSPPFKWIEFPLSPGKSWETRATVKGETFTSDVTAKAVAGQWEKVKVPAGEFDAIKVTWKESIRSGTSSGSGTFTYWISPAAKCAVKLTYSNTYGEKGQALLLSSK